MTSVEILEKLKLVPSQYLAAGAGAMLFLFWVYFILPVVSLFDLKKNNAIAGKKKNLWAIFIILFWGFGSWVYQILKGTSKFRKLSGFYGLFSLASIVFTFDTIKPYVLGPPAPNLQQLITELETQENPRISLAHRIDWASDLQVLDSELNLGGSGDKQKRQTRQAFLKLYQTFRTKNKINDESFSEWKNVFTQRDSLDKKTIESLIHAFDNLEADRPNVNPSGKTVDRQPIAGAPIPLTLKLGPEYPASGQSITVPLQPALKLDSYTKTQIIDLRIRAIKSYSQFLRPNYQPRTEIFGQIADGKPWYGELGLYFYGSGPDVTKGMSERSKSIVNPFALFWPSLFSQVLTTNKLWRTSLTQKDINHPEFPVSMKATQLVWSPHERRATLKMAASDYFNKLKPLIKAGIEQLPMNLSLEAINARDFGLDYIIWNESESKNIKYDQSYYALFRTKQFYQLGGSCGLFDGCNNLSPFEKELNSFSIKSLPATLTLDLWNEADIKNIDPDFKFTIEFE